MYLPPHPHHPLAAVFTLALLLIVVAYLVLAAALGLPLGDAWALAPLLTLYLLTLRARSTTISTLATLTALYGLLYWKTKDESLRGLEPAGAIFAQLFLSSWLLLFAHIRRESRRARLPR